MCAFELKKVVRIALAVIFTGVISACGGTSNDQGITFSFLGWYSDASGATQITGISAPLSVAEVEPGSGGYAGGSLVLAAGVQNSLEEQFIRTERIFFEYEVPGANLNPPDTSMVVNGLIGPAPCTDCNSSLPDSFKNAGNPAYLEVTVVPAEIRTWINLNREQLPEPPFTMNVRAYLTGLTSSGERYDTNPVYLAIEMLPDVDVPPTGPSAGSGSASSSSDDEEDSEFSSSEEGAEE